MDYKPKNKGTMQGLEKANKPPVRKFTLLEQYVITLDNYADAHSLTREEAGTALAMEKVREHLAQRLETNRRSNILYFRGPK